MAVKPGLVSTILTLLTLLVKQKPIWPSSQVEVTVNPTVG
jgi:hypothetical protein